MKLQQPSRPELLGNWQPPPRRILSGMMRALQLLEILNGIVQFWTGLFLFVLPCVFFFSSGLPDYRAGSSVTLLWVLNITRILKELTNWMSPCIEWAITPAKYSQADETLLDLLDSFAIVTPQELFEVICAPANQTVVPLEGDSEERRASSASRKKRTLVHYQTMLIQNVSKFGLDLLKPLAEGNTVQGKVSLQTLPHIFHIPMTGAQATRLCAIFDAALLMCSRTPIA